MVKNNLAVVICGGSHDEPTMEESQMLKIFDEVGIPHKSAIISAHRNPEDLGKYLCSIQSFYDDCNIVYICMAGMAAALPGIVASKVRNCPVIGVALPSEAFSNAMDAMLSMVQMPSDVPVLFAGIGESGCKKAAIIACQILAINNDDVRELLARYQEKNEKLADLKGWDTKKKKNK